ncbi:C-C motif chemokine 36.1 isoform X1 [Brachyistius frenatus]|uniref:C-C motif chemokine 36.1 isoform X1 n=1 Tax=Brachyistius frenatus TaxID=100188 RepID=UPI0037E9B5CB
MKTPHVLLLCVLAAALMAAVFCNSKTTSDRSAGAIGPDNCCFKFYPRKLSKKLIGSYYITDHRCPRAAAILVTKNHSRHICVDMSLSWVENILKRLEESNF